jgi:hypothetical protein
MAMCYHRLGQAEQARKWLAAGVKRVERYYQLPRPLTGNATATDVVMRLELRVLRREAEALVNGDSAVAPNEKAGE